ncbi:glutathione S-transferase [Aestuariicella hydrocarbonica]|uniref:Glutathione S-transferase n=1 Tax=Pseudomaricurvus hydrocarbonicus TaxID=1470433 RepID=A0A9E5JP67_9GAMM|nr:glutathione S-transferase family protein [Aestuariicella hydrocarbonica]NHO64023.1 glutathione S-transferase [Aestuariicella hydrocarbonica]
MTPHEVQSQQHQSRLHQLIGAEVSLYTGKLRSYLQYKNIPFTEITASTKVYREIILPRTGVRYIPVLITDDDIALQDTTEIIDFLEQRYPQDSVYPTGACQKLMALLLETYADEWLVIPAMHYRWNYEENREFAIREFGRTAAPTASAEEQLAIGRSNAKPFAGALPRLGVTANNTAAIEKSYLALLSELDNHFQQHLFLFGAKPSIGDFGLFGPLYAHLYRDPYSGRLMQAQAPHVVAWVQRMLQPRSGSGEFLPDDQIPETLLPILSRMFAEQGPVLKATIDQVKNWAANHEDEVIPRAIGELTFHLDGIAATRLTFPYMQWMWQRGYDAYRDMTEVDQRRAQAILAPVPGAAGLLQYPIEQRVKRQHNKLILTQSHSAR